MCPKRRFELNSLTALRLKEDFSISKARDFCDYLISKIEDSNRAWNQNRYDKTNYKEPIIYDIDIYKHGKNGWYMAKVGNHNELEYIEDLDIVNSNDSFVPLNGVACICMQKE